VSEKEIRIPVNRGDENAEGNVESESLRVDADVAKLATDLEDLRQRCCGGRQISTITRSALKRSAARIQSAPLLG